MGDDVLLDPARRIVPGLYDEVRRRRAIAALAGEELRRPPLPGLNSGDGVGERDLLPRGADVEQAATGEFEDVQVLVR